MKLTWFGGTALRIHIGGEMLVCDPAAAGAGVSAAELVSGADQVFVRDVGLPQLDPLLWKPRRPAPVIDETEPPKVLVAAIAPGSALVDAVGEPPLLILGGPPPPAGRWRTDAVVVAFDDRTAIAALAELTPRLIALAFAGPGLEAAIATIRDKLDGTALIALEPGLAMEV